MHKTFDFKKYVEYKVYSVTTIKNGYGFRVLLTFADESTKTQQHAGFTTKREANAFRDEVIGQLHTGTYIVYGKIRVEEFMIFWLEDIMRPRITDDTYTTYKSAIRNYIVPQLGKMYMSTLNQGYIRKLYNAVAEKYESVAKNVRTIMKTSLEYAFNKNVLATNPANGINLSKKIKKTEYRVLKIDEKKEPPMFKLSDTHYAATWLLDERAPKTEMPAELKARVEKMKKEATENGGL